MMRKSFSIIWAATNGCHLGQDGHLVSTIFSLTCCLDVRDTCAE